MINKDMKFFIVGLGLLGGAYAKALKKNGYTVYAADINEDSIEYALENNIIESTLTSTFVFPYSLTGAVATFPPSICDINCDP